MGRGEEEQGCSRGGSSANDGNDVAEEGLRISQSAASAHVDRNTHYTVLSAPRQRPARERGHQPGSPMGQGDWAGERRDGGFKGQGEVEGERSEGSKGHGDWDGERSEGSRGPGEGSLGEPLLHLWAGTGALCPSGISKI